MRYLLVTLLIAAASFSWGEMTVKRYVATNAGMAGLAHKCGMTREDGEQILDKLGVFLKCALERNEVTEVESDEIMKISAQLYSRGNDFKEVTEELCEAVRSNASRWLMAEEKCD